MKHTTNIAPRRTTIDNLAALARRFAPLFAMLSICSCDVGSVLVEQNGGDGGNGSACVAAATPGPTHVHTAGGTSNAGQACIAPGCHLEGNLGTGATAFAFAGTLYTSSAATTIVAGATVRVVTAMAMPSAVTDLDGNFVFRGAVTFPATTLATQCPSLTPMIGPLQTGGGNCNNCHRPGGTTAPIFLQ